MARKARSSVWLVVVALLLAACGDDGSGAGTSEGPNKRDRTTAGDGASEAEDTESEGSESGSGESASAGSGGRSGSSEPGEPGEPGKPSQPGTGEPGGPPTENQPLTGATDFDSADPNASSSGGLDFRGLNGGPSRGTAAAGEDTATPATPASPAPSGGEMRTVTRGDIYRVLGDKRILNLNAYRGLQVIDVSNVDAPRIEGRLAIAGTPVEMYVVGDRAIVLLNDYNAYYGSREDVDVERESGGLVLNVDISDRAHPKLLAQTLMKGNISTSRLTEGNGQVALYVAGNVSLDKEPYSRTLVKSFDVSGDGIAEKSEIDLGGYVRDVQATTADLLLVTSQDYTKNETTSTVSVIDISRPDGTMVKGGSVVARGVVQNKFNMDAYNGVLRVVSGANWNGTQENHLETFSLESLSELRPLDHCAFSDGQSLFATVFMENKGFFVTYLRQDPFHAFSIDDRGNCEEHNEFIVSGWNDFLRPALDDTRLIGIGTNDAAMRRTVSVSLYDTTNLDNPNPLVARADLALDNSYSEAQWDDRAFSVIEGAVSVRAPNETLETGLLLVPFQGYDAASRQYVARVQILTFSAGTLTRRGVMDHGSAVRRSFLADAEIAANLSDEELRLFDIGEPGAPAAKGKVEVAPSYRQVFVYGDYVARIHDPSFYFSYAGANVTPPPSKVEIVARSTDVDAAAPVAGFDVHSQSQLVQVGKLLVSVRTELDPATASQPEPTYNSTIEVFDLGDPTKPERRSTIETDRIRPSYGYFYPTPARGGIAVGDSIACLSCPRGRPTPSHYVAGDAIVFASTSQERKSIGTVKRCYETATCSGDPAKCTVSGGRSCVTPPGGDEQCSGSFQECTDNTCVPTDKKPAVSRTCSESEEFRYWLAYTFDPLDLRDAAKPVFGEPLAMDKSEEGSTIIAEGSSLYFNYQKPHMRRDDKRAYVKRYFKRLDFADPQHAAVSEAINIPGDVIAAEGNTVFTRDLIWNDDDARTLVSRLIVQDALAYMQASRVFPDRAVSAVELDGAGHMLVSSDPVSEEASRPVTPTTPAETPQHKLSILNAESLELNGEADVDNWATFRKAVNGRALYSLSGGLLVFNVEDAAKPFAQAYFPTVSWPNEFYFDGDEIMFAGGPYGIHRFDADTFNLLTK